MAWQEIRLRDGTGGKGVLALKNVITGRVLVCATSNIAKRVYDERERLRTGRHYNGGVQHDLDEHGPDSFGLFLIQRCQDSGSLRRLKYHHMHDAAARGHAYNVKPVYPACHQTPTGTGPNVPPHGQPADTVALIRSATEKLFPPDGVEVDQITAWLDRVYPCC